MMWRRMLLSPPPASPVNRLEPLCTEAMREPMPVSPGAFILLTISIRNSSWPSLERGVASCTSSWPQ